MKIGMMYAMDGEIESRLKNENAHFLEKVAGASFYQIREDVVACAGGVGKVNAAMSAQLLISRYAPDAVLNVGVAGCFENVPIGTLVQKAFEPLEELGGASRADTYLDAIASWEKGLTYVAEGTITSDEYMQKLERFVAGRTYAAVQTANISGLRGAFERVEKNYSGGKKRVAE